MFTFVWILRQGWEPWSLARKLQRWYSGTLLTATNTLRNDDDSHAHMLRTATDRLHLVIRRQFAFQDLQIIGHGFGSRGLTAPIVSKRMRQPEKKVRQETNRMGTS